MIECSSCNSNGLNPSLEDIFSTKITTFVGIEYEAILDDCILVDGDGGTTGGGSDGGGEEMISLSIPLIAGFNWISFNVVPEDASLSGILESIGDNALFIASQSDGTSTYYGGDYGWYGTLAMLEPTQMYKLEMAEPATLTITGVPVNVASSPISLIAGWNWIGYLPQNPGALDVALESVADNSLFIASQSDGISNNYGDYGWYGTLTTLEPGKGYLLEMDTPGELIYPEFDGRMARALNKQEVVLPDAIYNWDFNYGDYEFIGTITASIENREDSDGDLVGVFVDGECRGIAERMYFPFDDRYFYIIQVYSNDDGEKMTFKYYDSISDEVVEYSEAIEFTDNMVVGDGFNTYGLSRTNSPAPEEYILSDAYPNPFNPITTLNFTLPIESEVSLKIYNLQSREVFTLINGNIEAGYHSVVWDANPYASGVYFVKMIAGDYISTQKLMLVK